MNVRVKFLRVFKHGRTIYKPGEIAELDIPELYLKEFKGKYFEVLNVIEEDKIKEDVVSQPLETIKEQHNEDIEESSYEGKSKTKKKKEGE